MTQSPSPRRNRRRRVPWYRKPEIMWPLVISVIVALLAITFNFPKVQGLLGLYYPNSSTPTSPVSPTSPTTFLQPSTGIPTSSSSHLQPRLCTGSQGIFAYTETDYQGKCMLIEDSITDLNAFGFARIISSIRFVGSYKDTELALFPVTNFMSLPCETVLQDSPDLGSCSKQAVSVQVIWVTPPPS